MHTNPVEVRAHVLEQIVPGGATCNSATDGHITLFGMATLIRRFEEKLLDLFAEGNLTGTVHTALGQEAHDTGLMWNLDPRHDAVFANHRNHGQLLAWGADPAAVFAEIMGREAGICGGFGGSQHMHVPGFHSSGVQGGLAGVAVGTALAARRAGNPGISTVMLGDGTMGEGIVYEAMNLAAVQNAPVLFAVMDNAIAQTTPSDWTVAGDIAGRGRAFGLPTFEADAGDFDRVLAQMDAAVQQVRSSSQPALLICGVDRLGPHSKGDDDRSDETMTALWSRDPLANLREGVDADVAADIERKVTELIDQAVAEAESSPYPDPDVALAPSGFRAPVAAGNALRASGNRRGGDSLNAGLTTSLEAGAILIGEDLHDPYGGAFKVSKGLSTRFPDSVLSSPISEAAMVGTGIGLALAGIPTVVEVMFGDFVALAADQLVNQAAKIPSIYGRDVKLPLTVRIPSGGHRGYGPTHSQSLESMFLGVPNLTVIAPSHRVNSQELLRRAVLDWPYPTLMIEHKLLYGRIEDTADYRSVGGEAGTLDDLFPVLVRWNGSENPDITLIGYGGTIPLLEDAAKLLAEEELSIDIIAISLLSPLPVDGIVRALRPSAVTLVVEEGQQEFGFGAEVVARLSERPGTTTGRMSRLGARPLPIPASRVLEDAVLPTAQSIAASAVALYEGVAQ